MNQSISAPFNNIKRFVFGTIGMIVIIVTVLWSISVWRFIERAATAEGTVIGLNAGGSHPEIRFKTAIGEEIEYPQGGLISSYQNGDQVSVYYDSQNPRNCVINSFGAIWGFPLLTFLLGLVFILVAVFLKSAT